MACMFKPLLVILRLWYKWPVISCSLINHYPEATSIWYLEFSCYRCWVLVVFTWVLKKIIVAIYMRIPTFTVYILNNCAGPILMFYFLHLWLLAPNIYLQQFYPFSNACIVSSSNSCYCQIKFYKYIYFANIVMES